MLKLLSISNYALIDRLELEFSSGLNILTGETGAGKSIIVGAISLLMGGRSQSEYIRNKEEKTWVQGCVDFELSEELKSIAEEMGIPLDEDYLIVKREINPNGKSLARINGVLVQAGFLKSFTSKFLNIYGQHDFQILSDSGNHLEILDNIGGENIIRIKNEVKDSFQKYDTARKKVFELRNKIAGDETKKDFLLFQQEELEKLGISNGEEDKEIEQELLVLENQEKISALIFKTTEELYGHSSAYEKVGDALSAIGELTEYIANLKETEERLQSFYYELEDIVLELKKYYKDEEFDQNRLDFLNERKFNLQKIKKKYNLDLPGLILRKKEIEEELEFLNNRSWHLENADNELKNVFEEYLKRAEILTRKRIDVSKRLEEDIKKELSYLGMNNVVFKTVFETDQPGVNGSDKVEFLISANLGEEPKAIAKIASGGEMSRIMLSLKVIMTDDGISTMIFDEVDSGIGGETIVKVADKLLQVSRRKQVLCVTHSPQVASCADSHFFIEKIEKDNRTQTKVRLLNEDGKITEVSRMLGDKSEAGKDFALKLLRLNK